MKCSLFPFFFSWLFVGGGISGRALNLTVPLGSGQTISGTGRVRASVLSPCRPLPHGDTGTTCVVTRHLTGGEISSPSQPLMGCDLICTIVTFAIILL